MGDNLKQHADYVAPTGLVGVRYAIAKAAGWEWCEEHHRTRWAGEGSCWRLHDKGLGGGLVHPKEGWQDYDPMLRDEGDAERGWD